MHKPLVNLFMIVILCSDDEGDARTHRLEI